MNGQPSKPRVLVVDDERVIADTLSIILNQNGFDASAVYTGTAAVDKAKETKPELVISDVIMPDMNGIEAAIQIRQLLPGCKILLFPDRLPQPTCWKKHVPRGMSSISWLNQSIRRTSWPS
jgi:CheY-like chemotaxis protein